jgi:probable rRNA maturation factor
MDIQFFAEAIRFKLAHPSITTRWIRDTVRKEKKKILNLSIVFCRDEYLLGLNIQYLNHSTLTDILTFDYSESPQLIQGEIYVSIDRVRENSFTYKKTFDDELNRVIIHGVLHLIGYNDKTPSEKAKMREKEEAYLSLR